jgi:hypothetical protein
METMYSTRLEMPVNFAPAGIAFGGFEPETQKPCAWLSYRCPEDLTDQAALEFAAMLAPHLCGGTVQKLEHRYLFTTREILAYNKP